MRATFKLTAARVAPSLGRASAQLFIALLLIAGLIILFRAPRASAAPPPITNIATFLEQCPTNDPMYSQIRSDFEIRREGVVVGGISCTEPISGMTQAQYTDELIVVQALRTIYYMEGGRSVAYPWTSGSLYDWMKSRIGGIDIRANGSYCCELFGSKWYVVMNLQVGPDRDFDRRWRGMSDRISLLAHETRHTQGFPHVGGCPLFPQSSFGCDQTYDEDNLAPYGIQWWLNAKWLTGLLNVGYSCLSPATVNQIALWHLEQANNNYGLRFVDVAPPVLSMPGQPGGACPGASQTATPTAVPTATPSPTATSSPQPTPSPSPSPTRTPSPSPTPTPTSTPAPTPSPTPTFTPTSAPTPTPSPAATPSPTFSPPLTATPTPTATPTATPAQSDTATPGPSAPPAPTGTPTVTPIVTASPTPSSTPALKGDSDCDGERSPRDALGLLRDIGGIVGGPHTDCEPDLDANCDGHVDARDAVAVLRALVLGLGVVPGACLG